MCEIKIKPYSGYIEKLKKPIELKGRVIKYKPVAKLSGKTGAKSAVKKGGMRGGGEVHVNFDTKKFGRSGFLRTTLYSHDDKHKNKIPKFRIKISDFCKIGKLHDILNLGSFEYFQNASNNNSSVKDRCDKIKKFIKESSMPPNSGNNQRSPITDDDLSDDKDLLIYLDKGAHPYDILMLGKHDGYNGHFEFLYADQYMWIDDTLPEEQKKILINALKNAIIREENARKREENARKREEANIERISLEIQKKIDGQRLGKLTTAFFNFITKELTRYNLEESTKMKIYKYLEKISILSPNEVIVNSE